MPSIFLFLFYFFINYYIKYYLSTLCTPVYEIVLFHQHLETRGHLEQILLRCRIFNDQNCLVNDSRQIQYEYLFCSFPELGNKQCVYTFRHVYVCLNLYMVFKHHIYVWCLKTFLFILSFYILIDFLGVWSSLKGLCVLSVPTMYDELCILKAILNMGIEP